MAIEMLNNIRVFLLIATLVTVSPYLIDTNGYKLVKEFNAYYKFHYDYKDFKDAALICLSEKALLFYPSSMNEAQIIYKKMVSKRIKSIAVGIHNYVEMENYQAIDGRENYYTNWGFNEPNVNHNDVLLLSNMTYQTKTGGLFPFICKKNIETCPIANDYSLLLNSYNTSYKFMLHHWWYVSLFECLLDGAELFYPLSADEGKKVFEYVVPKGITRFRIGIHNILHQSHYLTMDGKTDFYANWKEDQPTYNHQYLLTYWNDLTVTDDDTGGSDYGICVNREKPVTETNCSFSIVDLQMSGNRKYELHSEIVTWAKAGMICQQRNAVLAMPRNQMEVTMISDTFNSNCTDSKGMWFGFSNSKIQKDYVDLNLKARSLNLTLYDWIEEESRCFEQGCGSVAPTGYLTTLDCNTKLPFVCEYGAGVNAESLSEIIKPEPKKFTEGTKELKKDLSTDIESANVYLFDENSQSAYTLYTNETIWYEALKKCNATKSSLAMPLNQSGISFISRYLKHNNSEINRVWLGFHNIMKEDRYLTVTDKPISSNNYNWFTKDNKEQGCGFVDSLGLLAVQNCTAKMAFICEFNTGYINYIEVEKSYKFSWSKQTWYNATEFCRNAGATLAMPTTATEIEILVNAFKLYGKKMIFVGFHTLFGPNDAVTLKVLKQVPDGLNWGDFEKDGKKLCGALGEDGLVQETCHNENYFFCEKDYLNSDKICAPNHTDDWPQNNKNPQIESDWVHYHWVSPLNGND